MTTRESLAKARSLVGRTWQALRDARRDGSSAGADAQGGSAPSAAGAAAGVTAGATPASDAAPVPKAATELEGSLTSLSDEDFLVEVYQELLGRPPDQIGLEAQRRALEAGVPRTDIVMSLATSGEHIRMILANHTPIQDLRELRPDHYFEAPSVDGTRRVSVFRVEGPTDVDWLEWAIREFDYYEKPREWSLGPDEYRDVMAELLLSFAPRRSLEIGCSDGTVMLGLARAGVACEGVDISKFAVQHADPAVRDRIVLGDLLDAHVSPGYDLIYGLDIFEHLNPNRLDAYLSRVADLLDPSGYVYANVPAYGADPVYGEVFPFDVAQWEEDARQARTFSSFPVDRHGYPVNGHLVWADWKWWVARFEAVGLRREPSVEKAVHAKYGDYFLASSPARKSLFIFSGPTCTSQDEVVARLESTPSLLHG